MPGRASITRERLVGAAATGFVDGDAAAWPLASEERRFAALVEHSSDLVSVLDRDLIRRYVSPSCRRILGYEPADLLGPTAVEIRLPEEIGPTRRFFAGLAERPGTTAGAVVRYRHKDGSVRWLELVATNRLDDPDVLGFVVNARDVTDRTAAEDALANERDVLQAIIDQLPDAVFSKDADGRYVRVNQALAAHFGYASRGQVEGLTDADLHTEAFARKFAADEEAILASGQPLLNDLERHLLPNGRPKWLLTSKAPFRDRSGRTVGIVGMTRDVTAMKRAEQDAQHANDALKTEIAERRLAEVELRRSEERFAKAFRASPAGMAIATAAEQRILDANDAFGEITGWHRVGAIGRIIPDLGLWAADPAGQERVRAEIEEQGAARDVVLTLTTRAGDARTVVASVEPIQVAGEACHLTVFRDVTNEREIDRLKSEFVSLVSHELRTPLTSIKGYVELVLDGEAGDLTSDQREFLDVVRTNAERLSAIVNDLLDLSKLEAGRLVLARAAVDLGDLIRELAVSFTPQFERKQQHLSFELATDLPPVWGEPARLTQVLTNLMSNAHKYTPAGGEIVVRAERDDETVRVEVQDNGIGLSPEDLERLFSRFFRSSNPSARQVGGTGLGLAIVRSLVELHGGHVNVESVPGRGSTFAFTVPIATETRV